MLEMSKRGNICSQGTYIGERDNKQIDKYIRSGISKYYDETNQGKEIERNELEVVVGRSEEVFLRK